MTPSESVKEAVDGFIQDIRRTRVILIRWMFFFWISQIVVLTGILFAFFRK